MNYATTGGGDLDGWSGLQVGIRTPRDQEVGRSRMSSDDGHRGRGFFSDLKITR